MERKPLALVELIVLKRVNDIEPADPEHHQCTQQKRDQRDIARNGKPGANRRNADSKAENEVAERREPLRDRVAENDCQRNRSQQSAFPVQPP